MKCPYCNKEMTEGYIRSRKMILFDGEFNLGENVPTIISEHNLTFPRIHAYCCTNCKKFIFDYKVKEGSNYNKTNEDTSNNYNCEF